MPLMRQRYDFGLLTVESVDFRGMDGPTDLPPTFDEAVERVERVVPRTEDVVDWMIETTAANMLLDYYAFSVSRGASQFGIASDEPSDTGVIVAQSGDGYVPGVTASHVRVVYYRAYARNLNTGRMVELISNVLQRPLLKEFDLRRWGHIFQIFNLKKYSVQVSTVAIDLLRLPRLIRGVFNGAWKLPGMRSELLRRIVNPSAVFNLRTLIPLPINTINLQLDVNSPDKYNVMVRIRDLAGRLLAEIPVRISGYTKYNINIVLNGTLPHESLIEVEPAGIPASTVRSVVVRGSIFG